MILPITNFNMLQKPIRHLSLRASWVSDASGRCCFGAIRTRENFQSWLRRQGPWGKNGESLMGMTDHRWGDGTGIGSP